MSIRRGGENRKLDRVLSARAFRARDGRVFIHHDLFVVLSAVITDIFVDWHTHAPHPERRVDDWIDRQSIEPAGRA
jgi:hypothetical protein